MDSREERSQKREKVSAETRKGQDIQISRNHEAKRERREKQEE